MIRAFKMHADYIAFHSCPHVIIWHSSNSSAFDVEPFIGQPVVVHCDALYESLDKTSISCKLNVFPCLCRTRTMSQCFHTHHMRVSQCFPTHHMRVSQCFPTHHMRVSQRFSLSIKWSTSNDSWKKATITQLLKHLVQTGVVKGRR